MKKTIIGLIVWLSFSIHGSESLEILKQRINETIAGQKAVYGIAYKHLGSGETLMINANDRMHAASTMKVPVMMRIFELSDQGKLSINDLVLVKNRFRGIVDGQPYSITVDSEENLYDKIGKPVPIKDLLIAMITKSSNLATNILIELADAKETTALMKKLGADNIQILRGVEDLKAFEKNLNNESDAAGMLTVMIACATSDHFRESSRRDMLEILYRQTFKETIPAGIPKHSGVLVANKTGSISRVEHDAAIIDLPNGVRYGLVIFARDFENRRKLVKETGRRISQLVYQHVIAGPQ